MKSWLIFLTEKSKKESNSLEDDMYTMFFKQNGKYYAAKEGDRILFAKIKTKDTKDINIDKENIAFRAKDIKSGKVKEFNSKEIKEIQICDKKEAESGIYKNTNKEENMCECKCNPCLKGKCEKCSCKNCQCHGCSCSK